MWGIIFVAPDDRVADSHCQVRWLEHEVANRDAMCLGSISRNIRFLLRCGIDNQGRASFHAPLAFHALIIMSIHEAFDRIHAWLQIDTDTQLSVLAAV